MSRSAVLVTLIASASAPACGFHPAGESGDDDGIGDAAIDDAGDTPDAAPVDAVAIDAAAIDARSIDAAVLVDARTDAAVDAALPMCPTGYAGIGVAGSPSQYRYVATARNWNEAVVDCGNDGMGMHLVVFETAGERGMVHGAYAPTLWRWIGLSDIQQEGVWVAVNGAAYDMAWLAGEPNNQNGEDCALLHSSGLYLDGGCEIDFTYVCECDP